MQDLMSFHEGLHGTSGNMAKNYREDCMGRKEIHPLRQTDARRMNQVTRNVTLIFQAACGHWVIRY